MWRLLQFQLPGALTTPRPARRPGCQTANGAPAGSAKTAVRPRSITSCGSSVTVPPASRDAVRRRVGVLDRHVRQPAARLALGEPGRVEAVELRDEVVRVAGHPVLVRPAEDVAVEGRRRGRVGVRRVDPARHAGRVRVSLHAREPTRGCGQLLTAIAGADTNCGWVGERVEPRTNVDGTRARPSGRRSCSRDVSDVDHTRRCAGGRRRAVGPRPTRRCDVRPATQVVPFRPGTQHVPASGTRAIAAASTVSATRSSGSRLWTCDLPHARASVCVSSVIVRR